MDPKTVLLIGFLLVGVGHTILNLLSILGLTKTSVQGGAGTGMVYVGANAMAAIGNLIFLILLITHGDVIYGFISFLLGK